MSELNCEFWKREWEAMEHSNRIRGDDAERLLRERDEARRVAAGLLRLVRAHEKHWIADRADEEEAAIRERRRALAALRVSVRRLVEGMSA